MAWATSSTPNIVQDGSFLGKTLWAFMGSHADASTAVEMVAAPGIGKSLYVTSIFLVAGNDANAFPLVQDGDATVLFGPFPNMSAGTTPVVYHKVFRNPIKVTANKALQLKTAAAGRAYVYIEGFTAAG